jgi:hypothetical protein
MLPNIGCWEIELFYSRILLKLKSGKEWEFEKNSPALEQGDCFLCRKKKGIHDGMPGYESLMRI